MEAHTNYCVIIMATRMLDAELGAQPPINIHTPSISIQPVPEFKCSICAQTWAQVWQFVEKIGSKRPPYALPADTPM